MAVAAAGASQGASPEHMDQGQSTDGAPNAPEIKNEGAGGDGIVPVEDAKKPDEEVGKKPEDDEAAKAADDTADGADEEDDEDDVKPEITEWAQFDDPSANAAIDLLKDAGVSPAEADKIFSKAVESGKIEDVDVAALEAKIGKTQALLVMNGVKDYHTRATEQTDAVTQMVHEMVGGEQAWATIRDWAQAREKNDKAFKQELDGIRDDLNKGGRAAKAATKDLIKLYNGDSRTKGLGNTTQQLTKGDGGKPKDVAPLTRAEYVTKLKEAHANGASPDTIAALDRRRMAGKKAGI